MNAEVGFLYKKFEKGHQKIYLFFSTNQSKRKYFRIKQEYFAQKQTPQEGKKIDHMTWLDHI